MRTTSILAALCCVFGLALAEVARYDNYHVYDVIASSSEDVKILDELESSSDSVIFLAKPSKLSSHAKIVVAPHKLADFADLLERHGMKSTLVEKNLQRQINSERIEMSKSKKSSQFDLDNYHSLNEVHDWLRSLEKEFPDVVTVVSAGKSYEDRELLGVKLSHKAGNPGVFIEAGIHAREWISPATVLFLVNELLTSQDADVQKLAQDFDWYVFPSVNPDGYVYTHEKARLWRKTRKPFGSCVGVDANRNWDFHWNEVGASSQPCADTYAGPEAASEPEVQALVSFLESVKGKVHLYLSFHSFSQLLLFPYGHTGQHADNYDDLKDVGNVAAKALAKRYGTKYTVGDTYTTIYPAAGTSIDWAKGVMDVALSYCYELRPKSLFGGGFELPAKEIRPTALETLDSLVALLKRAEELKYFERE
ncbi:zinc carboxypeptidase-like [Phlebotomus argentipes]|uniref:zinc carboxypeptidase-like n=1 Tax=Phlebotomus argentipes TaxID=94469 RepID=UPI0028937BA6|nr:zinc carboxypeptidase-like [Phlebotomus argentipes]